MTRAKFLVMVSAIVMACSVVLGAGTASASVPWWPPRLPPLSALPLPEPIAKLLRPPALPQNTLNSGFVTLQRSMRGPLAGQVGLALAPIGTDRVISMGTLKTARAWSTLKVPIALAAQRKYGSSIALKEDKAITLSDNDAAGDLWGSLGGGRVSVGAVTAVLREGHDARTRVSSEADRPPSYPGYTPWALVDQARFGAHLPCMAGSDDVIRLMSEVAPNQQWGIASTGHNQGAITAVKGGWGPATDASPAYVVRQLGIITTTRGQVAVSMAALPASGRFDDGTKMLTQIGNWLGRNLAQLPFGRC